MTNTLSVKTSSDMMVLDKNQLFELFKNANNEAEHVEAALNQMADAQERMVDLQEEQAEKTRISGGVAALLFLFYIVPGIIYIVVKNSNKKKYDDLIRNEQFKIDNARQRGREVASRCVVLPLIPEDYRTPLALKTMMKYLMNGQADTWKECSLRYDEQYHRWLLEQNSDEALEIQKYTAIMTEVAAENAGRAATAATVSAVSNILSWF